MLKDLMEERAEKMMGEASAVPAASRAAAVLLWIVAAGWGLPAPWLMWWVLVRGRLPVLPIIGEPNGGPFYFNFSRGTFVALLGASLLLAFAQGWGRGAPSARARAPQPAPMAAPERTRPGR